MDINQVRDEMYRMYQSVMNINEQIYQISDKISSIEEADDTIIRLRNVIHQTFPINDRLRELININLDYRNIVYFINNEEGTQYEINLFHEIHRWLTPTEEMFKRKTENLLKKIEELYRLGNARLIPRDQNALRTFNEEIISQSTCSICIARVVNTKLDCGHLFCINCAVNLEVCPFCRTEIKNVRKIYLKKYLKYRTKYILLLNKFKKV